MGEGDEEESPGGFGEFMLRANTQARRGLHMQQC